MRGATSRGGVQSMLAESCLFTHLGDQTITTGTPTDLDWAVTVYDYLAARDAADTTRIVIRRAGVYIPFLYVAWAGNINGIRSASVLLNGSMPILGSVLSPVSTEQTIHNLVGRPAILLPGDTLKAQAVHTRGADLDVVDAADYSPYFGIYRLGNVRA